MSNREAANIYKYRSKSLHGMPEAEYLETMEQHLETMERLHRDVRAVMKTELLAHSRSLRPVHLSSAAQFALILLSRKRRDDILNDLCDWYPGWVEHNGRFGANFACFVKIASAFLGQGLDVLYRIGEIVGKFRGAK